ncbi:MAG: hypothetical protein HQL87_05070 [Magnetococcales bacterium]|nr:hypothetical protein [Magnetococcales bacterium]
MKGFVQTTRWMGKSGGFSFISLLLFIGIAGTLFSMAANTLPRVYECFLLRELADRVVKDYARLPMEEVQRRVKFELGRSRIAITDETFTILPIGHGYRVTVHRIVPLEIRIGDRTFAVHGYEQWEFVYEVET